MEWDEVRVFLAVARTGSLAGAGRMLGLAQPTVGRRLNALEAALGQTLFQRGHTGLNLTEEGLAVVAAAEQMEEAALAFERRLAGSEQRLQGRVRVTASDWFGCYVLAPELANFGLSHPEVQIELLTDARLYDLSRRDADLAFRITPFEAPDVVSRRFMEVHYGLFVARGAPAAGSDSTTSRLITMDEAYSTMPDVAWMSRLFPDARIVFRSNSRSVQAQACASGVGAAVLPLRLAAAYPSLQQLSVAEAPPSRTTWVGYHRDLRQLTRLRALLDYLDERLAG